MHGGFSHYKVQHAENKKCQMSYHNTGPWYESYTYYGILLNDGACHGGISIKFDEVKGDLGRATCGTTMTRAPRSMACMGMHTLL